MADTTDAARPGYRGKCLYKTGKCNNERALKTSGQAHNLCDEHRHRQNEHQRKLDAKNRFARKDKRSGGKDDSPTARQRYAPYPKVRMSPTASADEVQAILGRNGIVATPAMAQSMMQFHALGVDGANAMAAASQLAGNGAPVPGGAPEILPSGVVILPNGPQAPQMPYPSPMQDFDGIVVPLPSYLEGHERVEFRSRIYQKVLDFIAEECMRRFGAVGPTPAPQLQPVDPSTAVPSERRDEAAVAPATTTADDAKAPGSATESETEKNAENDKDGSDGQPEDGDDGEDVEEEEEEEAPRAKRATRSRGTRKETQVI